jgi:hypothetical protein
MTPNIVDYEKIADFLNIDVEDQEVWEIARESQEIPLFENIYQSILLNRISHTLNRGIWIANRLFYKWYGYSFISV